MKPFETNANLVETVNRIAEDTRVLGRAPGGEPIVAAESGGDESPAIVLTAGSHATEHAGVIAAVELLDSLETEHELYVIPTRDPVGVNGYAAALEMALGERVEFDTYDELADILRSESDVLVSEGDVVIGLVGEYVFATAQPSEDSASTESLKRRLSELEEESEEWRQLRGRRIFLVPGQPENEGTGDFDRLYTLVVSPDGEKLHLNRFIGSSWAPAESRCTRELLDSVEPGLFVDIHEYGGDDYWVSVRPKLSEADRQWEERIGREMTSSISEAGGRLLPLRELLGEVPDDDHHFTALNDGLYDLDYVARGEGFNATDYAAEHHGLAFTHETGMENPLEERVSTAVSSVQRAVREFEQRFD